MAEFITLLTNLNTLWALAGTAGLGGCLGAASG